MTRTAASKFETTLNSTNNMQGSIQTSRQRLVLLLKGQKVHIPDLHPIFQNWPHGINTGIHNIRQDVEVRLER